MGCCQCCNKFFVGIVSIFALGIVVALVAAMVAISYTKLDFSQEYKIASIVLLVICSLLLIFAIYASCCGQKCARITLSILLGVICLVWVAIAVVAFVFKDDMKEMVFDCWNPEKKENFQEFIEEYEKANDCKGVKKYPLSLSPLKDACDDKLNKLVDFGINCVGSFAVVAAVFLLIAVIASVVYPKAKQVENEDITANP